MPTSCVYRLEELVDIAMFKSFMEGINQVCPFASAIVDNEGNYLATVGWRKACTAYHRASLESSKYCDASDRYVLAHIDEADPVISHRCSNGLVVSGAPIMVDGQRVGAVLIGQLFLARPDMEHFRAQARACGFDEQAYLKEIAAIPVWSEAQLRQCHGVLSNFVNVMAGIGVRNVREMETMRLIEEKDKSLSLERNLVGQIMEISPVSIIFVDAEGKVVYANRCSNEVFGGSRLAIEKRNYYNPDWGVYTMDGDPFPADELPFAKVKRTGQPVNNVELKEVQDDGRILDVSVSAAPLLSSAGKFMGMVAIVEDISGRKKREEEIKANLAEKEVLLKEIHHRVKNNLQVVSSLLNMQSRNFSDPRVQEAFRESRGRIKAMALVHEALYRSPDFTAIDFRKYFSMLVHGLFGAYNSTDRVDFTNQICECSLNVDTASSLGLILNELLSNALKHAFGMDRRGKLRVSLFRGEACYCLEVEDDGPGLPAGYDLKNSSTLGMQLITTLAGQLSGKVELVPAKGACFRLTFPG